MCCLIGQIAIYCNVITWPTLAGDDIIRRPDGYGRCLPLLEAIVFF